MNTRKIKIEGTNKTFNYMGRVYRTNIDDVRNFITLWVLQTYSIRGRDFELLSKSMQILIYKDNLKQKIIIVVTFGEVESKSDFSLIFDRINTYKAYINDIGFEMVKTALNELETKINK